MARINLKGYFLVHVVYEMWAASLVWEYEYSNAFDYLIEQLTSIDVYDRILQC